MAIGQRPGRIAVVVVGLSALAGTVAAHDVSASRFDAPVPLWLLYAGAGSTVAVTAAWLGYADEGGTSLGGRRSLGTVPAGTAHVLRTAARGLFLAVVALALAHGVVGRRVPPENLATVFVWPVWIKGIAVLSILAGSPWRVLSPWETVYDGLVRLEGDEIAVLGGYPERLGAWPAVVGFVLGIGVVENLTVVPRNPRLTVALVAGYALVMVLGGVAVGREWFRNADALAVLYRLFGRVAPVRFERTADGGYRISLRAPWAGCTDAVGGPSLVVFAVATVYTVSFDGFTNTRRFQTLLFAARDALGAGSGTSVLLYFVGLVGFVVSFVLASALARHLGRGSGSDAGDSGGDASTGSASRAMDGEGSRGDPRSVAGTGTGTRAGSDRGVWDAAAGFAATLLPIAAAYEVAHNYPFVARNAGQGVAVVAKVLTGSGPTVAPLAWLPLPVFWASQVALIVGGHLVAVVAAHRVAQRRYGTPAAVRRGHLPLVVVMVAYTVVSLWIVSRPVIAG